MVPLKLSLKNFLSYGQTTQYIDFEAYHLICLSGKNGHGKSALLDAITWALWGQARKPSAGAKADEQLVRLGQTHMMVCLEFMARRNRYKVRRELNITANKVQTSLDFGIIDEVTKQIKGLTDKTIRATQEKIIHCIGLDYESFIHSVFLRQGASNEFSKKSPKERKEILCSMLGITRFETIKKKAVEKVRSITTHKETLMPIYKRIETELLNYEPLKKQLSDALNDQHNLTDKHQQLQDALQERESELRTITSTIMLNEQAEERATKIRGQRDQALTDLLHARAEFRKIAQHNRSRDEAGYTYDQLHKQLDEVTAQEHDFFTTQQALMQTKEDIQNHLLLIEKRHNQSMHELDIEQKQTLYHIQMLHKQQADLKQKKDALKLTIDKKSGALPREKTLKSYEKYRERYQEYIAKKNSLSATIESYTRTLEALSTHETASCPTCNQALKEADRNILRTTYQTYLRRAHHTLQRLLKLLPLFKQRVINLHAQVDTLKETALLQQQRDQISAELTTIQNELASKQIALSKLETGRETLAIEQKGEFAHDHTYQQLRTQLEAYTHAMKKFPPDLSSQKQHLIDLMALSVRGQQLNPESMQLVRAQIKKRVNTLIATLKDLNHEYHDIQQSITLLKKTASELHACNEQITATRADIARTNEQLHTLLGAIGSYKEQLSRFERQQVEHERLRRTLVDYTYHQQVYQLIAQAVGKDGIQALLIEKALPDIEQEANYLLEKLTDNQAHLSIESLRDLKSGKTKETLDIHISDSTGIRAYELFSGGEAFRIDFALRIALSKILARKSGTSLQTLIIDEGFGSQDEEGLAHIMDALYRIQDDFAKIIIVSHLTYMKDQFPVHLVVHKSGQGSTIKIVEQG